MTVNLLRTHAIDYFHEASTQVFPLLRTVPDTKILWDNVNGYEGMMFNLSHPIVSDPLVRQAIAAAIDKAALAAQLTHGQATIATEDLPDWIWAFDPLVKAVRYDPALAVKLLARAGWVAGADGIVRKAGRPMQLVLATDCGGAAPLRRARSGRATASASTSIEVLSVAVLALRAAGNQEIARTVGSSTCYSIPGSPASIPTIRRSSPATTCRRTVITTRAIAAARWTLPKPWP